MIPIIQISNTINARPLSTKALRTIHADSTEAIRDYVNAREKEHNHINRTITKTPRTVEFAPRDSVDTPPAITAYVAILAPFVRYNNEISAHAKTAKALLNHIHALIPETHAPLWVLEAAPVSGKEHGRIYYADGNTNRADKPAFRPDWLYLFDSLSEDYNA